MSVSLGDRGSRLIKRFKRVMTAVLVHWTTRVADVKFRELEVDRENDKRIQL